MVVNVEDIIARRTRSLLLDARESEKAAPLIAGIMARELGHDKSWITQQNEKISILVRNYIQ